MTTNKLMQRDEMIIHLQKSEKRAWNLLMNAQHQEDEERKNYKEHKVSYTYVKKAKQLKEMRRTEWCLIYGLLWDMGIDIKRDAE